MSEQRAGGPTPPNEVELTPEQLELAGIVASDLTPVVPGGDAEYDTFAKQIISRHGAELTERLEQAKAPKKKKLSETQRKEQVRNFIVEKYESGELGETVSREDYQKGLVAAKLHGGALWEDPTEEDIAEHERTQKRLAFRIALAVKVAKGLGIFDPNYRRPGREEDVYYWYGSNLGSATWDITTSQSTDLETEAVPQREDESRTEARAEILRDLDLGTHIEILIAAREGEKEKADVYNITVEVVLANLYNQLGEVGWKGLSADEKQWIDEAMQRAAAGTYDFEVRYSKDPVNGKPQLDLMPKTN